MQRVRHGGHLRHRGRRGDAALSRVPVSVVPSGAVKTTLAEASSEPPPNFADSTSIDSRDRPSAARRENLGKSPTLCRVRSVATPTFRYALYRQPTGNNP
jgi:hypothetical protein